MSGNHADLVVNIRGQIGQLHLNRPTALNALSLEIIQQVITTLDVWKTDDSISAVVVTGEGDRAFCAGVDVRSLYVAGKPDVPGVAGSLSADLFRYEYTMDHRVATFPKPVIAYWDGFVMGGGVGISIGGSHRIATERTQFAMPETGIGLFPDVGASYFLSRLGAIGQLLGLTGFVIDAAATLDLGLATHFVPSRVGEAWIRSLARTSGASESDVAASIETLAALPESIASRPCCSDGWKSIREVAERCFGHRQMGEIMAALQSLAGTGGELSETAQIVSERLAARSPTSLKLTVELLHRGARLSYEQCLKMEYQLSQRVLQSNDFYEGVRAVLIDRDQSPRWNPASIDQVDDRFIESQFEPLEMDALQV